MMKFAQATARMETTSDAAMRLFLCRANGLRRIRHCCLIQVETRLDPGFLRIRFQHLKDRSWDCSIYVAELRRKGTQHRLLLQCVP